MSIKYVYPLLCGVRFIEQRFKQEVMLQASLLCTLHIHIHPRRGSFHSLHSLLFTQVEMSPYNRERFGQLVRVGGRAV